MKSLPTLFSRGRRSQRGVTLIEALVALVVMSFGMVALVGLQGNLRRSGDVAKQRSEAMRIAQAELATLRSFSMLTKPSAAPAGVKDYDTDIVTLTNAVSITPDNGNTTFSLSRVVQDLTEPQAKTVRVSVSWTDRTNTAQSVFLDTVISRTDPVYSMAPGITPPANGVRSPDSRNPVVPPTARDLGNGSSAFRPDGNGTSVWIFNNVTGVIIGKCEIPVATALATAISIDSCRNPIIGYLVSGTISFSALEVPNPASPEADALPQPLTVTVNRSDSQFRNSSNTAALPNGGYTGTADPVCFNDAPATSTPAQKVVNYYCIVYPNTQTPPNWWGQVLLGGDSLPLGTTAGRYKVCRYSGDYNGNGYTYVPSVTTYPFFKIDNEEHPETYRGVSYSLARQNFLVMPGKATATCPLLPADATVGRFVDYSTYQIQ